MQIFYKADMLQIKYLRRYKPQANKAQYRQNRILIMYISNENVKTSSV